MEFNGIVKLLIIHLTKLLCVILLAFSHSVHSPRWCPQAWTSWTGGYWWSSCYTTPPGQRVAGAILSLHVIHCQWVSLHQNRLEDPLFHCPAHIWNVLPAAVIPIPFPLVKELVGPCLVYNLQVNYCQQVNLHKNLFQKILCFFINPHMECSTISCHTTALVKLLGSYLVIFL